MKEKDPAVGTMLRRSCWIGATAMALLATSASICAAGTYQCIGADGSRVFSDTPCAALPPRNANNPPPVASANRAREIGELWGYLHLGSPLVDYDTVTFLLARTVAPLDANWGPSHVHWAAVNTLIRQNLHEDIDPIAARSQSASAALWQRTLSDSLSDMELDQLLHFYRSALGKDYVAFQVGLSNIADSARAASFSTMMGQTNESRSAQPATPAQMAARQRVQDLSLPMLLISAQPETAARSRAFSKVIVATRSDALDSLKRQYDSDLSEFDRFNHSAALGKVVAAEGVIATSWPRESSAQELHAALAAEPQKRAAQWRAAYVTDASTSPQLPETSAKFSMEIEPGDPGFPATNSHPTHRLEIVGSFPQGAPLGDLQAIYATDITSEEKVSGPCQRFSDSIPKESAKFFVPQALEVTRTITIGLGSHGYRADVDIDRFQPGPCNWHLREIGYRLFVQGYGYRREIRGQIQVRDARHRAIDAAKGSEFYSGQLDIWCGKILNRNISPYYPVRCGALDNFRARIAPQAFAAVPVLERESHSLVFVSPETPVVRMNFHDVDALPAAVN
jgi:Domain of unknown function (DUF4124)